MWNPKYFHEMMMNRVIITKLVSPSQSWTRTPEPEVRQGLVDEGARLEHQAEDDAGDGLGQDVGHEEDQAEDRPAAEPAVEQDGERRARTGSAWLATGR